MPGYRRKPKTYTLRWADDHELAGLEVVMRGLTIEKLIDFQAKADRVSEDKSQEGMEPMFRSFAKSLISWNLEDEDGQPVPATYKGVVVQDVEFVLDVVMSWVDSVASVRGDSPLPETSGSGLAALEASLTMEPLSASPVS